MEGEEVLGVPLRWIGPLRELAWNEATDDGKTKDLEVHVRVKLNSQVLQDVALKQVSNGGGGRWRQEEKPKYTRRPLYKFLNNVK